MKCPFVIKKCSKCGKLLVANTINFHKRNSSKCGLLSHCKECEKIRRKKAYENNKEKEIAYAKEYQKTDKGKEVKKKADKKYRETDTYKSKAKEYQKKYSQSDKGKETQKKASSKYRKSHPDKIFNQHNERRKKLEQQGKGITNEQWLELMTFFDWCCAYSGIQFSSNNEEKDRSIDHIIPLDKGGKDEIWNLVPMYKSYNSSKKDKDMITWYKQQSFFSEERLEKIIKWQEYAFNKWGEINGK